jgi:hypothetical protein
VARVVECLPSKSETLSSNPGTIKKKKEKEIHNRIISTEVKVKNIPIDDLVSGYDYPTKQTENAQILNKTHSTDGIIHFITCM